MDTLQSDNEESNEDSVNEIFSPTLLHTVAPKQSQLPIELQEAYKQYAKQLNQRDVYRTVLSVQAVLDISIRKYIMQTLKDVTAKDIRIEIEHIDRIMNYTLKNR